MNYVAHGVAKSRIQLSNLHFSLVTDGWEDGWMDRGMDKEDVVHIGNEILLSH